MPGLNRTGPFGAGSGTGWGLGRCGAYAAEGFRRLGGIFRGVGRGGAPWGGGRGRCFGGRGMWRSRGFFPDGAALSPSQEAETLKAQLASAEEEIAAMRARLEELEAKK